MSGMSLVEAVNRHLRAIGQPEVATADLSYSGTGIANIVFRFLMNKALDYFTSWNEGTYAEHVTYTIGGAPATLNIRTSSATVPSGVTFNMAMGVRGSGRYKHRAFKMDGTGLVTEFGTSVTFAASEVINLDVCCGPVFNTGAADDTAAWTAWFEAIAPEVKMAIIGESVLKFASERTPDELKIQQLTADRQRDARGVERAAESRASTIVNPAGDPGIGPRQAR